MPATKLQQTDLPQPDGYVVTIPVCVMAGLRVAARSRDTSVNRLVYDLLTVIAAEPSLVRAILDTDEW